MCLINIWLSKFNTFNQVQSHKWIRHSLNIDMCDVYGYQRWDNPQSNVKLQWSIQPRHTQLALRRVTNLNYRSMHIWPLTKLDYIILKLFSWLHTFHNIWSFWNNTSHFEIDAWNFWYINLISMHTSWVFFTLSHTQPLHNSHINTWYLITKIQVNLAWNKANTWLNKFNLTST